MKEPKVAIWNFVKLFVIYIQTPANGSRSGLSGMKFKASSTAFMEESRLVISSESLTAIAILFKFLASYLVTAKQ